MPSNTHLIGPGNDRAVVMTPADLGMNGVVAANGAPVTSNTFLLAGWDDITIYVFLDYVAATRVDVELLVSPIFDTGATAFHSLQSETVAAGTATLSTYEQQKAVAAADLRFATRIKNLNAVEGRLRIEGVNGTTDTITVYAIRGNNIGP